MKNMYKQSLGYFRKNLLNVLVLGLLTFLTSFMYFFVEASIDKNLAWLSTKGSLSKDEKALLAALNSNKILASSFLIFLLAITCFVFFMFYKKILI
ncbi:hypothetical protein ACVR0S_07065 [Streptococcus dentapri]|uniref:ABC transporter permease n=1 Tax=Streptococcus dentapri TaxID=573564 RepID=A0ABV8D014_9STRE